MNRLTKSSTDKALFGVCGGIAEHFGISPFVVRLIFIFTPNKEHLGFLNKGSLFLFC
ncbi:PspC domain-containing protein [Metabacillus fastidiosus]|uniref:PspC domain-containing protein n=1 Tax=Metabacillus fastidiosus TaxID=1458 RepID=UPI003D2E1EBC